MVISFSPSLLHSVIAFMCVLIAIAVAEALSERRSLYKVRVGQPVALPCESETPVVWRHKGHHHHADISVNGRFRNGYGETYSLVEEHNWRNLTIKRASFNESGKYECIEDNGAGDSHHFTVQVEGKYKTGHLQRLIKFIQVIVSVFIMPKNL